MKNIAVIICLFICAQTLANTKEVVSNKTTNNLSLPIEEGLTTLAAVILQNPDDKFTIRIYNRKSFSKINIFNHSFT
jgi:hypothetical protein